MHLNEFCLTQIIGPESRFSLGASANTTGSLGLLLSSDLGGSCLTVFVVSKSWVPDFVIHSVPSQSSTAGYLELLSNGSDSGSPNSFEGFNKGRVLGFHSRVRAPVTVISRLDGVQTTLKIGRS